ncbi:MAG: DUF1800 domain-containing protein [Pseudomonadota bacterium]
MAFDPTAADMRFGYGLSPVLAAPVSVDQMLQGLQTPDVMAQQFPIEPFYSFQSRIAESVRLTRLVRRNRGTDIGQTAYKERRVLQKTARQDMWRWMGQTLLRRAHSPTPFRERLVGFWGDHFAARGKVGVLRRGTAPYHEDGIRPFIAGRFADLLQSAVMHPLMLHYLDQDKSVGPASFRGKRSEGRAGLNENLAREVLELHTLGVDGPYTQQDVTQLAELFTGLSAVAERGFVFRKNFVEPGAETVLGVTYANKAALGPIRAVLEDLARHPATARHLARKLAVHFVSDAPDPGLVDHVAQRYADTGGDLSQVYAALLEHPAAWTAEGANIKPPEDFVASAMRALAVKPEVITPLRERQFRMHFALPLQVMGQAWQRFDGPDGWPEDDSVWTSPAGVAGRVQWAMGAPSRLATPLPDPRQFVDTALGPRATPDVVFAAGAAESQAEAIGIVLMSPAFQRR